MRVLVAKFGIGLAAAAAVVAAVAGPAAAESNDLPQHPVPMAGQGLLPETGSAGAYNNLMCWLHTMSADVPCMYT